MEVVGNGRQRPDIELVSDTRLLLAVLAFEARLRTLPLADRLGWIPFTKSYR